MHVALVLLALALAAHFWLRGAPAPPPAPAPAPADEVERFTTSARTADPSMRALLGAVRPPPPGLAGGEREATLGPGEARGVLDRVLAGVTGDEASAVALEAASKTVNGAGAAAYRVLCTVYLRRANVVRRVEVEAVLAPTGELYVPAVRQFEHADTSALQAPGERAAFAAYAPVATYRGSMPLQ